jgi:hypothetical protein
MTNQEKQYLNVSDVAERLMITEKAVRALFHSGELKGRKVARRWITTADLLKQYIEQGNQPQDGEE